MKAAQEWINRTILADPNTLEFFSRISASNTPASTTAAPAFT